MDIGFFSSSNSSSSDSDLESKIKLTCTKKGLRCNICQDGRNLIEPTKKKQRKNLLPASKLDLMPVKEET